MLRRTALYALCLGMGSLVSGSAGAQTYKLLLLQPQSHAVKKSDRRHAHTTRRVAVRHTQRRRAYAVRSTTTRTTGLQAVLGRYAQRYAEHYESAAKQLALRGKIDPEPLRMASRIGTQPNPRGEYAIAEPLMALRTWSVRTAPIDGMTTMSNPSRWLLASSQESPLANVYGDGRSTSKAVVAKSSALFALEPGFVITGVRTLDQKKFTPVVSWESLASYLGLLPDTEVVVEFKTPKGEVGTTKVPVNKKLTAPGSIEALKPSPVLDDSALISSSQGRDLASGAMVMNLRTAEQKGAETKRPATGAQAPKSQTILTTNRPSEGAFLKDPGVQGQSPFTRVSTAMGEGKGAVVKDVSAESPLFTGCAIIGIRTVEQSSFRPVRVWADIVDFAKSLPDDEVIVKYREPGGAVKECKLQLFHSRTVLHDDML